MLFKALLPYEAQIENDLEFIHYALGVVVHPNVVIGRRVRIYHQVTLAAETWIGSPHKIIIEDGVHIGTGSIVIARPDTTLTIGKNACIAAGAVVTRNVAPGVTVVGVPASPLPPRTERTTVSCAGATTLSASGKEPDPPPVRSESNPTG
jgi:serine acetyltransferase